MGGAILAAMGRAGAAPSSCRPVRRTRRVSAIRTLGALALALASGGCFSDRGLAIQVDIGDTGATMVELYIGTQPCSDNEALDCSGIAPPDGTALLRGAIWFRDAAQ